MTTGHAYGYILISAAALLTLTPSPAQLLPLARLGASGADAALQRHGGGLRAAVDAPPSRPRPRPPRRSVEAFEASGASGDPYHLAHRRPPPPPQLTQLSRRRPTALRLPHHNRTDVHGYVMSFAPRFPPSYTSTFGPPSPTFSQTSRKPFSPSLSTSDHSATFPFPDGATFKAIYPSEAPATLLAPEVDATAPTEPDTPQAPTPDVHVVAMSVSTSVKKGSESEEDEKGTPSLKPSFHGLSTEEVSSPCAPPPLSSPASPTPDSNAPQRPPAPPQAPPPAPLPLPQPLPQQGLPHIYGSPEENFEVDEAVSVLTNGRAHGRQPVRQHHSESSGVKTASPLAPEQQQKTQTMEHRRPTDPPTAIEHDGSTAGFPVGGEQEQPQHSSKPPEQDVARYPAGVESEQRPSTESPAPVPSQQVGSPSDYLAGSGYPSRGRQGPTPQPQGASSHDGKPSSYVVEGRNFRKYRVEEKTSDGFIVGEYGVVSHDDGSLRGVRYTADSTINPRLIYDALLKFLSL